jgi:hypothetical protein
MTVFLFLLLLLFCTTATDTNSTPPGFLYLPITNQSTEFSFFNCHQCSTTTGLTCHFEPILNDFLLLQQQHPPSTQTPTPLLIMGLSAHAPVFVSTTNTKHPVFSHLTVHGSPFQSPPTHQHKAKGLTYFPFSLSQIHNGSSSAIPPLPIPTHHWSSLLFALFPRILPFNIPNSNTNTNFTALFLLQRNQAPHHQSNQTNPRLLLEHE